MVYGLKLALRKCLYYTVCTYNNSHYPFLDMIFVLYSISSGIACSIRCAINMGEQLHPYVMEVCLGGFYG